MSGNWDCPDGLDTCGGFCASGPGAAVLGPKAPANHSVERSPYPAAAIAPTERQASTIRVKLFLRPRLRRAPKVGTILGAAVCCAMPAGSQRCVLLSESDSVKVVVASLESQSTSGGASAITSSGSN